MAATPSAEIVRSRGRADVMLPRKEMGLKRESWNEASESHAESQRPRAMSDLSRSMLSIGHANVFHSTIIHKLLFFERSLDIETLRRIVKERFAVHWKLQHTVTDLGGGDFEWGKCVEPDLEWHVKEVMVATRERGEWANQSDLNRHVEMFFGHHMDFNRPLWEVQLLKNVRGVGPESQSNGAILVRLNHAIGDGISLSAFILGLYDEDEDDDENDLSKLKPDDSTRQVQAIRAGMNIWPRIPFPFLQLHSMRVFLQGVFQGFFLPVLPKDNPNVLKIPCRQLGPRKAAIGRAVSLQKIKDIKCATGSTVNDVMTAVIAGVVRSHLAEHDTDLVACTTVHAAVLVNMRSKSETARLLETRGAEVPLGNAFNFLPVHMPVAKADSLDRLYACKRDLDDLKHSPSPVIGFAMNMVGLKYLPRKVVLDATYSVFDRVTTMFSNVPGPKRLKKVAGIPVHGMVFFSPGLSATNFGIISYNNKVLVSVLTDANVVPDPHALVNKFAVELDKLWEETMSKKDFHKPTLDFRAQAMDAMIVFATVFFLLWLLHVVCSSIG